MNPVGIHYGYWAQCWNSDPFQFIVRAQTCGFDVLEINTPAVILLSHKERDALKTAAETAGIAFTYSVGMKEEMDLASEDTATRKRGVAFLKDVTQAVKIMGGSILAGVTYGSWPRKLAGKEDKRVLTDRAVAEVREAIKFAEDCEVTFCLEVVNRFEHFMMNTAAEAVAFAKRVDSPNCKLLLDTFHMNIEEDSFRNALLEAGNLLGHFHLGETNRRPPGLGRIPWPEIFVTLQEINYQGVVVLEPFIVPGGEIGHTVPIYRDLLGNRDIDEEAARSAKFVRSQLR
jgi:D-psicose/D-tagatose/L-ribulose 3-epimerase